MIHDTTALSINRNEVQVTCDDHDSTCQEDPLYSLKTLYEGSVGSIASLYVEVVDQICHEIAHSESVQDVAECHDHVSLLSIGSLST